jgi:hypothetical protein
MPEDYEVLGGHENVDFRDYGDHIEVYSTEVDPDTGEQIGHVGVMSHDEMRAVGTCMENLMNQQEAVPPELDDMEFGQDPVFGAIMFIATDENGEKNMDKGAAFGDPHDIIDAADSL